MVFRANGALQIICGRRFSQRKELKEGRLVVIGRKCFQSMIHISYIISYVVFYVVCISVVVFGKSLNRNYSLSSFEF